MNKFVEWLNSEEFFPKKEKKEKKPIDPVPIMLTGGMLACGALAVFGSYKSYKNGFASGVKTGSDSIRDHLLRGDTWDVTAKDDKDGDKKAIVTICGIISNNEDEYVENLNNFYKNRNCSEENLEKYAKLDRENYQNKFSKYMDS